MKTAPSKAKSRKASQPFDVIKVGSISIPICANNNIIPKRDPQTGAILYENLPDGKRKALVKHQSAICRANYGNEEPLPSQRHVGWTCARRRFD